MRFSIPVTPDPDTARQWAQDELSKSIYQHGESLADRLGSWFSDLMNKLLNAGSGGSIPPVGYLLGAIVLIALIVIATRIAIPAAQQRRRRGTAVLLADDARTAQQIRDAAQAASRAGDHTAATLEYFRALVRGCEERVVIDDRAGRTAREAAIDIAASINLHFAQLRAAAQTFDALRYGHRVGTAEDSSRMKDLEAVVRGTRAVHLVAS
ncbi:DUF4129 domain-containing protein [Demequina lutea]|uniref:Protein-glutamine gamma-glutamyltransferase-like C-terminal domain-containing protein n=1 Tax=Demequina lutea TaxID=431489 RepID=A0A7Y9ZCF6_9MICO|nr:DUF4129 domain-containing protein [Demequina lutea]NYI40796.1 hypothetical protein [Demequina lutea]